jgi:hypothetical protein
LDLYTGFPINEKVDIWGLGMLLYRLLFNIGDDQVVHVNGKLILTDEMIQSCNPIFIELLKGMTKPNPKERLTAVDVVTMIEKNAEKINEYNKANVKKKHQNFVVNASESAGKMLKKTSTQFAIYKLASLVIESPPKLKYMKQLISKAWNKRQKITKLYQHILARPIHYNSIVALKTMYILHYYLFYGPNEVLTTINLDDFLGFFNNIWTSRYTTENYDKDDYLKNSQVSKFITSYSDFIKLKLGYLKKYNYIDLNYSIERLKNNFDFSLLIEKKFLTDTLSLYSQTCQKFIQVPINVNSVSSTHDCIIQIFNEEIISLFNFIFYLLVAYKFYLAHQKNENGKLFDSHFFETTNKAKEYLEKFKKFRGEIRSKNIFYNFPSNYTEYLNNLDVNLKHFGNDFNINNFFSENKEVNGIRLNKNIGKLFESNNAMKGSRTESFKSKRDSSSTSLRKPSGFDFSDDKFKNSRTSFNFDVNMSKRASTPDNRHSVQLDQKDLIIMDIQNASVKKITEGDCKGVEKPSFNFNNANAPNITFNFSQGPTNYMPTYINNTVRPPRDIPRPERGNSLFNCNFFSKSHNNGGGAYTSNVSEKVEVTNNTLSNTKVFDILNGIFDTNDKSNDLKTKTNSNENLEKEVYDSNKVKELLKEFDNTVQTNYKNQQQLNFDYTLPLRKDSYESNVPNKSFAMNSNVTHGQPSVYTNDFLGYNQQQHVRDNSMQWGKPQQTNTNAFPGNSTVMNNNTGGFLGVSNTVNNDLGIINTEPSKTDKVNDEEYFESINSNFNNPNINIITIQNHYNNYGTDNKPIESVASSFLMKELSKGNLHWLISSKDIELGKQIGFGGSSEVYVANYRGTEVAVKKLRIMEVKDEILKEFKREVSSLVMLRHPNLVLFMGAM